MKIQLLGLLVVSLVIAACASTQRRDALVTEIQLKGNDSKLTDRVERGERLSVGEIEQLRKSNVSVETIIDYIKVTRSVYMLSKVDVERLQQQPGNDALIEFMLKTPELYHPDNLTRRAVENRPDDSGGYVPYYQKPQ